MPVFLLLATLLVPGGDASVTEAGELGRDAIAIRDPFVLPVAEQGRYYLFGTGRHGGGLGFYAFSSRDLDTWRGPLAAFVPPADFWAHRDFWAPEVHKYRGKYYLFATFAKEPPIRGTQILMSASPCGPFEPISPGPQTPPDWQCLDGTLFVEDGKPWMVFCHEWTQVEDGEMCAVALSDDLRAALGEPMLLFHASDAPWVEPLKGGKHEGSITDGPWLHRTKAGGLLMLWSSFGGDGKYKVAIAHSTSGKLAGPWRHEAEPLFEDNGGHPMLFRTFEGKLMLSLHAPNHHPSRARFLPVEEVDGTLRLVEEE